MDTFSVEKMISDLFKQQAMQIGDDLARKFADEFRSQLVLSACKVADELSQRIQITRNAYADRMDLNISIPNIKVER